MTSKLNRRDFLKLAGLTTLGVTGGCAIAPALSATPNSAYGQIPSPMQPTHAATSTQPSRQKKRVLRIAHMTDFHVEPGAIPEEGMRRALRHAQAQEDPPDIILNTGDSIRDSLETDDKGYVEAQWELFKNILTEECLLPVVHALGNHDVWGWGVTNSKIKNDPLYGKGFALEKLGLPKPYYSFDRAGWHFVVLDSTHTKNEVSQYPYIGRLDEEQFHWLVGDVETVVQTTPICVASHIPILAACEYLDGPNEESGNWVVPAAWMHIDARQFRQLFLQFPNIHLCLSGHTHQYEVLDYLGVRYMTNGAVCGNWWNGDYMDFTPAYVMVNLYDDGTADSLFMPYGEA